MKFMVIGTNVIAIEPEPEAPVVADEPFADIDDFPFKCVCYVCEKPFFGLVPEADLCETCERSIRLASLR